MILMPSFSGPAARRIRVLTFCFLGVASFMPIVHGVLVHGFGKHDQMMSLKYYVLLGMFHLFGAAMYGARVPERLWPRRFDLVSELVVDVDGRG